ncbi:MAG: hypothetical protein JWM78_376 [Verrucomicrobiaceae bacterium]|nr:hypothetical protein [Verrucomicrobiaceae bacterium]
MSGFAADWLKQRAPFDLAARSTELALGFRAALRRDRGDASSSVRIIDLAAGTGANFRALAPLLGGDQDWLLVDYDPLLIAAQTGEINVWAQQHGWCCSAMADGVLVESEGSQWRVRSQQLDLAQSLERLDLEACAGVTTTAFLDLVSAAWLDKLAALLAHFNLPLLATLSVDGRREWQPSAVSDMHIQQAFLRHQAGDKGFGIALGEQATPYLKRCLTAHEYRTVSAHSDWKIGADHAVMLLQMAREAAIITQEVHPEASIETMQWLAQRTAQISARALTLQVGHVDLLAVPASSATVT